MSRLSKDRISTLICLLMMAGMLMVANSIAFASTVVVENPTTEQLNLVSGKSKLIRSSYPVSRVSVANPEITDFLLLSAQEIYITGKTSGSTNLTLWRDKEILAMYDVNVAYDLSALKQRAHEMFPNEQDLKVVSMHDTITLSGRVSSASVLSQALALAKAFAPEGKVTNLVEVGGGHQVMDVKVHHAGGNPFHMQRKRDYRRSPGHHGAGKSIGAVIHFFRQLPDSFPGFLAETLSLVVEDIANYRN